MRAIPIALVLFLAAARLHADTILYANQATTNGVDGFCIRGDGSLEPTPAIHVDTVGTNPRALVVGPNHHVLYVAEAERVEAFAIGPHGALSHVGSTPEETNPNLNALDVAVSADGTLLYVPDNGLDLIAAYPLDPNGAPAKQFTSCIKGTAAQQVQRVIVQPPYLYAAAFSLGGRVSVYPLDPNGALENDPNGCLKEPGGKDPNTTCPISERRNISKPRGFVLDGEMVYTASIFKNRVITFTLTDGLFAPPVVRKTGETVTMADVCANDAEHTAYTEARRKRYKWQDASSRTAPYQPYQEIVLADGTVYAAQFENGRIDAFRLKSDGNLPNHSTGNTHQDFRGTPVGLAVRNNVLYVAGGEFDLVEAFRLTGDKRLPEAQPFSQTDVQKNTFPNALAIADLDASCP
jgi:6-phosphogluconolactonase (cycloisomerase 2 family)